MSSSSSDDDSRRCCTPLSKSSKKAKKANIRYAGETPRFNRSSTDLTAVADPLKLAKASKEDAGHTPHPVFNNSRFLESKDEAAHSGPSVPNPLIYTTGDAPSPSAYGQVESPVVGSAGATPHPFPQKRLAASAKKRTAMLEALKAANAGVDADADVLAKKL